METNKNQVIEGATLKIGNIENWQSEEEMRHKLAKRGSGATLKIDKPRKRSVIERIRIESNRRSNRIESNRIESNRIELNRIESNRIIKIESN